MGDFGKESTRRQMRVGDQVLGTLYRGGPRTQRVHCVSRLAGGYRGCQLPQLVLLQHAGIEFDCDPTPVSGPAHPATHRAFGHRRHFDRCGGDVFGHRRGDHLSHGQVDDGAGVAGGSERPGGHDHGSHHRRQGVGDHGAEPRGCAGRIDGQPGQPAVRLNIIGVHPVSGQRAGRAESRHPYREPAGRGHGVWVDTKPPQP
ncbi:hypothetical protein A9W98_04275 [Mycobacterium gordonae]|uniref:Uncharacterized protein n=1 Tax=Mycobacterium gordonae TaxID=1778 RepID=A0A1A6B6V6_MYCGO|nr:hypothetical protein A9W98_04275 [Mycobacterium gordonae]